MPIIKIHRKVEYADRLRSYHIYIDGNEVGTIKAGEATEYEVSEGKHIIQLKISWCYSNELEVDTTSKKVIGLTCGNSMVGVGLFLSILYLSIYRKKYLWIKES